jgi:membrane protein implicated in regulation of membrane protease activity
MNDFLSGINPSSVWLIVGVLLIILEIVLFPGIGFLFAGLGAISVATGLIAGWIDSLSAQFILFFLATGFWTAILWKPLKKFIGGKGSGFDDMVGSTAVVFGQSIEKGKMGEVKWSGAIMKCQLDPGADGLERIDPETEVIITGVSKGVLMIRAKSPDG